MREDDPPQHGDREVRLADARRADEAQPLPRQETRRRNVARAVTARGELLVRIRDERIEVALAIARRHARLLQQLRRQPLAPAVAALDATHAVDFNRLPSGVVAERAGHDSVRPLIVTARARASVQITSQLVRAFRASQLFLRTRFDLTDPFAREIEHVADFLQRARLAVAIETEAKLDTISRSFSSSSPSATLTRVDQRLA